MSSNPVQHQRTKHIEIDIHFVRDLVARGVVRVFHVPSSAQYADIFTKGLPTQLFNEFKTSKAYINLMERTWHDVCPYDAMIVTCEYCGSIVTSPNRPTQIVPILSRQYCDIGLDEADHILLSCPVISDALDWILQWCNVPTQNFSSVSDFVNFAASWGNCPKKKKIFLAVCYGFLWSAWKARNDKRFKNIRCGVAQLWITSSTFPSSHLSDPQISSSLRSSASSLALSASTHESISCTLQIRSSNPSDVTALQTSYNINKMNTRKHLFTQTPTYNNNGNKFPTS
ncbi:hypothetical protein LXL04_001781 [Taraxacum kok-saghyz]